MAKQTHDAINSGDILTCLRMHLNQQRPVTLHNTYQGVPVSTEAEVGMVHEDFIGLIVHPYQAVCIKEARYTFIETKSMPDLIRASSASIDFTNHVVLLKQFTEARSISIDLEHACVAPEHPIGVELHSKNRNIDMVEMLSIAVLDDNRVRVVMAVPKDVPYQRGEKASLSFRLDPDGEPLSVVGKVHSLIKIRNKDQKRLEVDGRAVMLDEVTILAYIARREDHIMSALDKAYKRLRKGKKAAKR